MRSDEARILFNLEKTDTFQNTSEIPPDKKLIELSETGNYNIYDVYMDESRINNETVFAECIFRSKESYEHHLFRLNNYNSVVQAELGAINFATSRALDHNTRIAIFTDSQSSIETIKSAKPRSEFANKDKCIQCKAIDWRDLGESSRGSEGYRGDLRDPPAEYQLRNWDVKGSRPDCIKVSMYVSLTAVADVQDRKVRHGLGCCLPLTTD
ncbi:hypothetical protein AVEN_146433-1 [Araneus ventricosus]|uniref:RNase H type-1 domain-containing protein n=1 Tax=Araneus ventricosus TaxID=182803 RepID=A0A4Y2PU17_ARAVE|nr:hypothetical protein AVEN_146433-1 [Araneus ventricosus]